MPKITFIGAGSTVFTKNLLGDILAFPELATSTIALHDIDEDRLHTSEIVARNVAQALKAHPKIESTTDRRAALDGADYAICMIQVAGYKPGTVIDFEIPKKYGLRQTIADTLGIGGIMRGLRTVPVLLEMTRDMVELCPSALFLNYVNPMAINCWALHRATNIQVVGLCHSVPHTAGELAHDIGLPIDEINYLAAGINHMAFYLRFERKVDGVIEDLYPRIHQVISQGRVPLANQVRYDMLQRLGYFVTESSEHFSEYVPWFIKRDRPDLIEQYHIPLDEYIRRCEEQIANWEVLGQELKSGLQKLDIERSVEYGSLIIHSMETGKPRTVYANVPNNGLISNLPPDCIVEVPCLVDKNGLQPTYIGSLPPHIAALIQTNVNVQRLTVEAVLTRKRDHIYHAAMLDPHTAAELDLDQIWSLVDELIAAHGDWLPQYN
ncbi:MAG: alpha-galactosidase [Anaerolineae bacterium SG8_19]|jgi:alpha-galactosidase|nr:MAG: alpha-galactosidase [Anaerolineae bacterium SG8_19]